MRRTFTCLPLLALLGVGTGCPPGEEGGCGEDAPDFSVMPARFTVVELEEGDGIPVYVPPQTGVFSEFNVRMWGIALEDVGDVDIRIANEDGVYAETTLDGQFLNIACSADGSVEIIDIPLAYTTATDPSELDGIEVDFRLTVNDDPDYTREVSAVLVAY